MGENTFRRRLVADICLILALLLIGGGAWLLLTLTRERGSYVSVQKDGEEIARYSLSEDGEYPLNGGTNLLVIEGGEVYMKDADCPDRVCVGTGRIGYAGQSIICLPNRLSVVIVGEEGVDLVS